MQTYPTFTLALLIASSFVQAQPAVKGARDGEALGLYAASAFRLSDGQCKDCQTPPQALWYFPADTIATPRVGTAGAEFDPTHSATTRQDLPSLIWIGSSKVIDSAQLTADGQSLKLNSNQSLAFNITPQLASNRSYYNAATQAFYQQRPLRLRGELVQERGQEKFIARSIWPKDFTLAADAPLRSLQQGESLKTLVRANHGGAAAPFASRVLWERTPGSTRQWDQLSALGIMLNGAQGDDDEAHGGHFAITTGRYRQDGDWSNWLVNNFYNLDSYSEKGIVAAVTPMDKYLMDLNNGQSFYRPSYMLVALLKNDQPAALYQGAINRVYNHLYRHDMDYNHSRNNCAGISVDTLQALGWNIPKQGPSGYAKAIGAYAYVAASERSLEKGRQIYDYLVEDQLRLYPALAFDVMGNDLLQLAQGKATRSLTPYEQALANNIEAILYVSIPQIPSSRALGLAPVYSFNEYMQQAPADRSQWQVVPTEPRPFPEALRDGQALPAAKSAPVPMPVAGAGLFSGMAVLGMLRVGKRWRKRRQQRKTQT